MTGMNDFKCGQELLEDKPHCERPSTSVNADTISKVKEMVRAYQWITSSEALNKVGISMDQHRQFSKNNYR
jgi:hypothetical protein